jgi:high affinity Mn2+ porin
MHQLAGTNATQWRASRRTGQANLVVIRCVKTWIENAVCAFALVCAAAGAEAADSPSPIPTKASMATPSAYDWSGAYLGGHFTYSSGHTTNTLFDSNPTPSSESLNSFYGGLQLGYNYVIRSGPMLGIEGDVSFPYFLDNGLISSRTTTLGTTVTEQIDYVATLRARFGYAFGRWLPYMTGGFAWSQARFVESPGVIQDEDKVLRTRTGWVTGLGTEVALAPDWTARLEYLYYSFDGADGTFPSGTRYGSVLDIQTLRLGLNHRFGGPDAAGEKLAWVAAALKRRCGLVAADVRQLEHPRPAYIHRARLPRISVTLSGAAKPFGCEPDPEHDKWNRVPRLSFVG